MLAFVIGFRTTEGRAHLRHALQLDPRNPQNTVLVGKCSSPRGNSPLQERAVRRALALDPLWRRLADAVADSTSTTAVGSRPTIVERFEPPTRMQRWKLKWACCRRQATFRASSNSEGRREHRVCAGVCRQDESGLVAWPDGDVPEALLIGGVSPFDRLVYLRRVPDRQIILAETLDLVGCEARKRGYSARARIGQNEPARGYCSAIRPAEERDQPPATNRRRQPALSRNFGRTVGRSLSRLNRHRESARLFDAADEAIRVCLARGGIPPSTLADLAASEAILGRRRQSPGIARKRGFQGLVRI